jgi:hypothetical protein
MAVYADLDNLIADYLPEAKSDAEKATLGRILASVTAAIDSYCKRRPQYFAPAAEEASPRYLAGEGKNYLRLPVHVLGSINPEEGVDCNGHPITNWVERGGWLYQTRGFGKLGGIWQRGVEYTVNARWGYEATPDDVTEACRQLVVHYFERQSGTIGQVTPNGFVIDRDMPPTVKTLLAAYRRKEFEVQ